MRISDLYYGHSDISYIPMLLKLAKIVTLNNLKLICEILISPLDFNLSFSNSYIHVSLLSLNVRNVF